jgi:4-amino-4-deoxy-L-arabinose transferase-like glycosyltransferase
MVGLVAHSASRRYGVAAGFAAGFALTVMPRVHAHAHLGALDTFIASFWTLSLLAADRALTSRRPVAAIAGAGGLWALALLTKIHAWFLIPVVLAWSIVRLGLTRRAAAAFGLWLLTGLAFYVAGWPWLWYDTAGRLRAYLGTGVERVPIRVLYFGQVYADREVPWHYPWFYFAATVPLGLHAFGAVGLFRGLRGQGNDRSVWLLIGPIVMFLAVFSTSVPVYDGERLFLTVFPLWAILVGRGYSTCREWAPGGRWGRGALGALLIGQAYGLVAIHPFGLSYYNRLVGGLPGAEARGLELTYWGDAVDGPLLDRLAAEARPDDPAALVPTLYPGQGAASTTRPMARRPVILGDQEALPGSRWLVVSRRTAYWPHGLAERLTHARLVADRRRHGVWLSALYRLDRPADDLLQLQAPVNRSRSP